MGQVLHGGATTTEAVRRAIHNSQESLRALAKRYGINQKTVAKWKQRETVGDFPTGPKEAKSTVLSIEEEAIIVAFRRHTLLPLDDCLYVLQPTMPHLTRSSLHRCLQRHGISRLPEVEGNKPSKKKFKAYPIGYFHIDIAEVQTAEGKLYLYVADRSLQRMSRHCENGRPPCPIPVWLRGTAALNLGGGPRCKALARGMSGLEMGAPSKSTPSSLLRRSARSF